MNTFKLSNHMPKRSSTMDLAFFNSNHGLMETRQYVS